MQCKSTKKIQMTIIAIFLIFMLLLSFGNNVIAYSSHNLKAADFIKTEIYMKHTTYYVCINSGCDYKTSKTEECKLVNFKKIDDEKHIAECDDCKDKYELPHVDENNDGKCDDCKCTVNGGKHICLQHSNQKIVVFDNAYHDYYAICTLCENPVPDWQKREQHDFGEITSKGSKGHSSICKTCGYELIQEHEGANHENGGICTVKGCGYQYETHEYKNGKCQCGKLEGKKRRC